MAPFERASMTSYSTLMVTMDLSASVSKLQPTEICLTSILTSQNHPRSKPMAPFERASMTSYSTLTVTMALSASISKVQGGVSINTTDRPTGRRTVRRPVGQSVFFVGVSINVPFPSDLVGLLKN